MVCYYILCYYIIHYDTVASFIGQLLWCCSRLLYLHRVQTVTNNLPPPNKNPRPDKMTSLPPSQLIVPPSKLIVIRFASEGG